jgi:hypothetical protein
MSLKKSVLAGLLTTTAILGAASVVTRAQDDPMLQSAKITFSLPEGDDKDDNTAVDVFVSTRVNGQWEATIAGLQGLGQQTTWEDDGAHSYSYDLAVSSGMKKSVVIGGGVKTQINWNPTGRDRAFFTYTLVLRFADGSELKQNSPRVIEMSEQLRTFTNP